MLLRYFLISALGVPLLLQAQVSKKLTTSTDSTLASSLKSKLLTQNQFAIFNRILWHRANDFKKRIDSTDYDYVIIEETVDTSNNSFKTNETYIAKGFIHKYYINDKYCKPNPDYINVHDTDTKLIFNWSLTAVDSLFPEPIIFYGGCIANPSPHIKKEMSLAEKKEKASGGYLSPKYTMLSVVNLKTNTVNIAFLIPIKKIREVKYECGGGD